MCPEALSLTLERNGKLGFVFRGLVPGSLWHVTLAQGRMLWTGHFKHQLCLWRSEGVYATSPCRSYSDSVRTDFGFTTIWRGKSHYEAWLKWLMWNTDVSFCLAPVFTEAGLSLLLLPWVLPFSLSVKLKASCTFGSLEEVCSASSLWLPQRSPGSLFPSSLSPCFSIPSAQQYMQTTGREVGGGIVFLLPSLQSRAIPVG